MPAVAEYAPGSRVLEDERRVPCAEAPAVGPGLAREARVLVVRVLRHPERVRLGHARPVVREEHVLARVDARSDARLGLHAVKPPLGPGRPQVQCVGLPVQERDRLADVGPERVDEVVCLRLGGSLVASVARVVVAAEQLAGRQRLVGVPAEALVGAPCAACRLHDDEVAGRHVADD